MVNNRIGGWISAFIIALVFTSGCAGHTGKQSEATTEGATLAYTGGPVELIVQDRNSGITQEEFKRFFVQAVQAKYPEISLKLVTGKIEDMIVSGAIPDLVAVSNPVLYAYTDIDYPEDLRAMIKKYNVDLGRIEPEIINELGRLGKNGAIYGLPFGMNYGAMIYNKDIFDKFGVPYPNDSLTWEEVVELTKRLTIMDNGVQYIGGAPVSVSNMLKQYGVSSVDAQDQKAVFTLEGHKHVYSLVQQFLNIPGFVNTQTKTYSYTNFFGGNLGMSPNWISGFAASLQKAPPSFNWGITSFPVFKDRPNKGNPVDFHMLLVSKSSKNKEAAYRAVLTLLSDEVQLAMNKNGRLSVLKDLTLKTTFAEDSGVFKGKSLEGIFKASPVPSPDYTVYKAEIAASIDAIWKRLALEKIDINTALRDAEEETNRVIRTKQEQSAKK